MTSSQSHSHEPTIFMSPLVHNRLSRIENELSGISTRLTKIETCPLSCLSSFSPRRLAGIAELLFANFKPASRSDSSIDASTQTAVTPPPAPLRDTLWNRIESLSEFRNDRLWRKIFRFTARRYARKYERDIARKQRLPRALSSVTPIGIIDDSQWLPLDFASKPSYSSGYVSMWRCSHRAFYKGDNKGN